MGSKRAVEPMRSRYISLNLIVIESRERTRLQSVWWREEVVRIPPKLHQTLSRSHKTQCRVVTERK